MGDHIRPLATRLSWLVSNGMNLPTHIDIPVITDIIIVCDYGVLCTSTQTVVDTSYLTFHAIPY